MTKYHPNILKETALDIDTLAECGDVKDNWTKWKS